MPWMLSNINSITFDSINKKNILKLDNIIVDSKSGYSGAGRSVHKIYAEKIFTVLLKHTE